MSELTQISIKRSPETSGSNIVLAAARTVWIWLRREWRVRSTLRSLEPLNDHLLKDIGLERSDIVASVRERCADL